MPLPLPDGIESARLTLRPWRDGDADELHEALLESVEHLRPWIPWATPYPSTLDDARALLVRWIDERAAGRNFIYAVRTRDDARLVGGIGLYDRVGAGRLEVGYWLRRTAAGAGLATEATEALTEAGFALPGVEALEIHVDPRNRPSLRVPEKLGYRRVEPGPSDGSETSGPTTVCFIRERAHPPIGGGR